MPKKKELQFCLTALMRNFESGNDPHVIYTYIKMSDNIRKKG